MTRFVIAFLCLCICSAAVQATPYRIGVSYGRNVHRDQSITQWRFALDKGWKTWFKDDPANLSSYFEMSAGQWISHVSGEGRHKLQDVGADLIFRLQPRSLLLGGIRPYLDAGGGLHFLTHRQIVPINFSSGFQFNAVFGAGVTFGARDQYGIAYRFRHFSNGHVALPDRAVNFNEIQLSYGF